MRKKLAALILFGLAITTGTIQVEANPTAGVMNVNAYSGYENPTQYVFSNYDIWKPEKSTEGKIEETIPIPKEPSPVWNLSENERYFLKRTVLAECGYNQPDEGVRMVVDVILNRVGTEFGNDIYGVVSNPYQFSTYWDGAIASTWNISEQVDRIVEEELQYGTSYPGLMYFTAGGYNPYCTPWQKVGDHYFGI